MIYSSTSRRNYSARQRALFAPAKVTLTQRFTNATLRAEHTNPRCFEYWISTRLRGIAMILNCARR
jgi:hypothetical protein